MNKLMLRKNWVYFLILFTIGSIVYGIYNDNRRKQLFKNSLIVKGILLEEIHESVRTAHGKFYFFVNHKKVKLKEYSYFSHLKKGDTVLIEYAVEDPTVARVIDKYYMKKYKNLNRN